MNDHAHWVNTLALNTDFILRTGPYDQLAKRPVDDADGKPLTALSVSPCAPVLT